MSDAMQGPFVAPPRRGDGQNTPTIGIGAPNGLQKFDPSAVKSAILRGIELGYRHFQATISLHLEQPIGDAIAEAMERGIVRSREELFIACKIPYNSSDLQSIISDLKNSLENMKLEYVDLYLAEAKQEEDGVVDRRLPLVWSTMEWCQKNGLTKSIGACNFSSKMLETVLEFATIPPSVNQVRMHHLWRDKELKEFCLANGISIIASSTFGGKEKHVNITDFVELEVLKKFAKHSQKSASQVLFRWAYEQGAALLLESFEEEHMKEILNIFEWKLLEEE